MVKPPICIHWYRGWSGPVAHPAAMSSARAVVAMGGLTKINEIWWGYHGVSVQSCSMLSRISVYIHTVIYTFFVPISISIYIYIYTNACVCVIWVCRKLGDAFKIASCCSSSILFHLHSSKITFSFFFDMFVCNCGSCTPPKHVCCGKTKGGRQVCGLIWWEVVLREMASNGASSSDHARPYYDHTDLGAPWALVLLLPQVSELPQSRRLWEEVKVSVASKIRDKGFNCFQRWPRSRKHLWICNSEVNPVINHPKISSAKTIPKR